MTSKRLYQLVRQDCRVRDRTFEIEFRATVRWQMPLPSDNTGT